jgi:hypothetical protein
VKALTYPAGLQVDSRKHVNQLLAGGSTYTTSPGETHGVLYRSWDGGKSWYRIFEDPIGSSTSLDDALPIVRNYWNQNIGSFYQDPGFVVLHHDSDSTNSIYLEDYFGY